MLAPGTRGFQCSKCRRLYLPFVKLVGVETWTGWVPGALRVYYAGIIPFRQKGFQSFQMSV